MENERIKNVKLNNTSKSKFINLQKYLKLPSENKKTFKWVLKGVKLSTNKIVGLLCLLA